MIISFVYHAVISDTDFIEWLLLEDIFQKGKYGT